MTVRSSEGIPTYEAVSSRCFQTVSKLDFVQFFGEKHGMTVLGIR